VVEKVFWAIENSLLWTLDITFNEDRRRKRDKMSVRIKRKKERKKESRIRQVVSIEITPFLMRLPWL
jgi:predicted transposase YbfD/YdcC